MNPVISRRIDAFRKKLAETELDAMLILVPDNRYYLSGFSAHDSGYDESSGALLISENSLILATDSRFTFEAKTDAAGFEVWTYTRGLATELPEMMKKMDCTVLGFEPEKLSCKDHQKMTEALEKDLPGGRLVPKEGLVEDLRVRKDADELRIMKDALILAENGLKTLLPKLSSGMTELAAAWELEKILREAGAEGLSFPSIVAGATNAAKPHATPSGNRFEEATTVLFDWGCILEGYCSDITRTFYLGRPDDRFMEIFEIVRKAQEASTAAIRPGAVCKDVDAVARTIITDAGYGDVFGHGLGHGVGLAVHENPRLSFRSDTVLEPGMVVTVEPGIYLPDWGGIRLENMVVVTEDGHEVLNSTSVTDFLP